MKTDRESLAVMSPILDQIKLDETGDYEFHPTEKVYPLIVIDRAIDLYARVSHLGLQDAIKDISRVFELTYIPEEDRTIRGVAAFTFKVVGQRVDVSIDYLLRNVDMTDNSERVVIDSVIELANAAERVYLCRALGGINVNIAVHRWRDVDFIFTFKEDMLNLEPVPAKDPT
ncbi:hypothetical protein D3C81_334800 [compost metagenome]